MLCVNLGPCKLRMRRLKLLASVKVQSLKIYSLKMVWNLEASGIATSNKKLLCLEERDNDFASSIRGWYC